MDLANYDMRFELQRSYFLRDLLSDVFEFDYENQEITMYRIKDKGIKERCCVGDVIYYIHVDQETPWWKPSTPPPIGSIDQIACHQVSGYLGTIERVKQAIENMKIIYECEPDESDEEETEETEETEVESDGQLTEVSTTYTKKPEPVTDADWGGAKAYSTPDHGWGPPCGVNDEW
jgi:hypothetical protein